jgi:hypothetical protein
MANCSAVDGQSAFLGEPSDHRPIDYFQSLEMFREAGLPCTLPIRLEESIRDDPDLLELERDVDTLVCEKGATAPAVKEARRCVNRLRSRLKKDALSQYQEEWVEERRDWKIQTRGAERPNDPCKTDLVESLCLLIPERGRLACAMTQDKPLSSDSLWRAMRDLQSLCTRDLTVLYLQGLEPRDGSCPVMCCQIQLDR